ncbi:S-adenosylmethionine decarboxylase proenzyme [Shewanella insulae]|uniref:S-adenosylmethionine decarboxylase proenzyme n=1 Tax=Shewanella insulae TaxID=2681496 RepID=UPI001EFDE613|nr:S-adenosylmethionine decarboxylase proenzyme [Shewanella insulae]MCG9711706.1 S-adenosylmethionine decarboxylase proenzyme [Shewanella insulae]
MYFEGAEKRLSLTLEPACPSLRALGDAYWRSALAQSNTEILSKLSCEQCDAYLLSESSLFVWHDSLVLITCGNTRLIETVVNLVESLGPKQILGLSYQRKSEILASLQSSRFEEDLARLRELLSGDAYRMGHLDGHYHQLFLSGQMGQLRPTQVMQMYHIRGELADYLRSDRQSTEGIARRLNLTQLLSGFHLDTHLFSPLGYSLNALRGQDYFTLHITPQEMSSYVSLETNLSLGDGLRAIVVELLNRLNPVSWDIAGFDAEAPAYCAEQYSLQARGELALADGQGLYIKHYKQRDCEQLLPVAL